MTIDRPLGAWLSRAFICVAACIAFATAAQAQTYPDRPVHILVGFAAGSGPDVLARAVAAQLGADLGQNFIVENRPGANGTIATAVVAQAAPDGYTLLYTSDSIAPTPFIYKSLPYNVFKDLAPIATVGVLDGLLMLVNPSSPAHNVKEFIDYAKKNPVFYGSPGIGNGLHLAAALFNKATGLHMEHVPFKGASEVSVALSWRRYRCHVRNAAFGHRTCQERPAARARVHRLEAVSGIARRAADEGYRAELSAGQGWGIFLAPAKTPPALDRQAQRRDPACACGAGRRQCGAEIRLHAGRPFAGADRGVLPRASRGSAESGAAAGIEPN